MAADLCYNAKIVKGQPQARSAPVQAGWLQHQSTGTSIPGRRGAGAGERVLQPVLRHKSTNQSAQATVPPIVHEVLRSPGQLLDAATRTFMESRLGHDFSHVRVHANAEAAAAARAVHAQAFTVGREVVFAAGQYAPGTSAGRQLLAHELAHVVQQGHSDGIQVGTLRLGESGSPQEREADHVSYQVVSGAMPEGQSVPTLYAPVSVLQRSPFDDFKQRVLDEFRIDLTLISPTDLPVVGTPRVGARRNPDGTWTLILGNERQMVGADEIGDILRGLGSRGTPGGGAGPSGPTLPTIPRDPLDPRFTCRAGEYFDFITLRCLPEVAQPESGLRLTMPEFRLPKPRLTLTGVENVTIDHFALDSAALPSGFEAKLDRLVSLLNAHADTEVHIDGYTDSSGTEAHNQALSEQRAEAVRRELVRRGVTNPERLRVQGFGETSLWRPEERTAEERAENRRVEIWFVLPPGEVAEGFRLRLGDLEPPSTLVAP
jgi:hypothetical protein